MTQKESLDTGSCQNDIINWVKTSDRVPKPRQKVLVYNGYKMFETSWCIGCDQNEDWFKSICTYWTEDVKPPVV